MATGQIDAFRERMRDQVRAQQAPLLGVPHLVYDADAAVSEIAMHPEAVATLSKFGPFGMGNPHPTVRLSGKVLECRILGANLNVLRFTIGDGTSAISCIKFGFIHEDGAVPVVGEAWDAVGKPEFNIWNGSARLQIGLDDYRLQCA
jgi:single-stranded DNA-specific DHH superfamily exonuclease